MNKISTYGRVCVISIVLFITVGLLFYCTSSPVTPSFNDSLIVNAYMTVGQAIDSVRVSRSLPLNQSYTQTAAAVSTDSIFITVDGHRFQMIEYDFHPGIYYLPADSHIVTPGSSYRLDVNADGQNLHASTQAPGQVEITHLNTDTTYYPIPDPSLSENFYLEWTPTDWTAAYEISVIAQPPYELIDWGIDQMIEHRLEETGYDTLRAFEPVSDFPVSENESSVDISWFAFCYYGDYTIKVYAIDENLWDLVASSGVYGPQSSQFEQPVYNIDGGLGIFAAVSVDSIRVHVKKQDE